QGAFAVFPATPPGARELPGAPGAQVMKLPSPPIQYAARHAEEDGPVADALGGLPVVCCSLHSQVAPVCAALAGVRVAYVQVAGGALPLGLSDTLRALRQRALVGTTVSAGACFGGEHECVTAASAFAWAAAAGFDAVVCAIGPGIVGTGSRLGHGGLAAADAANTAAALEGQPVLAVRVSSGDERQRHQGVSHHTRAVVELCLADGAVAWPPRLQVPGRVPAARE